MIPISEFSIRKMVAALAGAVALLTVSVGSAGAQETQSQALERLDRVMAALKDVREQSRRKRTLEEALESSISRYTCVRLWSLGMVLGELGAFGSLKAGVNLAFRLPTPVGFVQTYGFDNGAPLSAAVGAKGVGAGMLDFSFGTQNWNCWSDELPFPSPELYDVGDYELAYSSDDADMRQYSSDPENSTAVAVAMINSLVSQVGELGLDPGDPQVAARLISGNVEAAVESFPDIISPGLSLADRAVTAPGKALDFLYDNMPSPEIAQGIDNALSGDWLSQANPCQLVPGIETVCSAAQDFGERLVDVLMLLADHGELIGAAGIPSLVDVVGAIEDESAGQFSRIHSEVERLDGVRAMAENIKGVVSDVFYIEERLEMVYQPFKDVFEDAREIVSDLIESLENAYYDSYQISQSGYFYIHGFRYWCYANVIVSPSEGAVTPDLNCS